ncbi:ABC transporter substrate-binding protein [Phycisphaerales bacterium AB-hyl4]|uniref:ABC transporter substrate-binding protein n=1 Tax=Natronomicrosphaera hydrolytica TaxID=3242702 RepID=A0ABV4UBM5_9BACT
MGVAALLLLTAAVALCVGCERAGDEAANDDGELRLVSLAPGLTQMVVDLGLGDRLVGVAEHDASAPRGLPVVGNYADVNTERLVGLSPTHVLTLTTTREPPRRLRELAEAGRFELVAYRFPFSIDDVRQTLHRDAGDTGDARPGPPPLGEALGVPERARVLLARFDASLGALRELTADRDRPRVLLVIGHTPLMASGPGTVHDQLLEWVGGRNATAGASVTAPTYDREGVLSLSPEVILLLSPDAPPLHDGDARLRAIRDLPVPAMRDDRVYVINHPQVLLASTSLPEVAATLATAIHPDLADEIAAVMADHAAE